jgi:hypothetical protein
MKETGLHVQFEEEIAWNRMVRWYLPKCILSKRLRQQEVDGSSSVSCLFTGSVINRGGFAGSAARLLVYVMNKRANKETVSIDFFNKNLGPR